MKANKWENCFDCPCRGADKYCLKLRRILEDMDFDKIHPDCPLPDWPEVSNVDVWKTLDCVSHHPVTFALEETLDWLHSIGVIVKEKK